MKRFPHLPQHQRQKICNMYRTHNTSDVLTTFGISPATLRTVLESRGLRLRPHGTVIQKYEVKGDFFDKIDTEAKAYFLGLMGSDGNVSSKVNKMEISLTGEQDKHILEEFKSHLGFTGPIASSFRHRPTKKPSIIEVNKLSIVSKSLRLGLISQGIVPRKSLVYRFNEAIPQDLVHHYVRGYFDGDGSIYHTSNQWAVKIVGTREFVETLRSVVDSNVGVKSYIRRETDNNTFSLGISGDFRCYLFCRWMYSDSALGLNRKRTRFNECRAAVIDKINNPYRLSSSHKRKSFISAVETCASLLGVRFDQTYVDGIMISPTERENIIRVYGSGKSLEQTAEETGKSLTVVRKTLHIAGIVRGHNGKPISANKHMRAIKEHARD